MAYSESFWITTSGVAAGMLALAMYYWRSTLLTSRCSHVRCCFGLFDITNRPIRESQLHGVLEVDRPPVSFPGQPPVRHGPEHV